MKNRILKIATLAVSLALVVSCLFTIPFVTSAGDEPAQEGGGSGGQNLEELILDKTAKLNDDGTVTLTVETYVTGEVTYEEEKIESPADIVVVLDCSSSMRDSFGSGRNAKTKYSAMGDAVKSFVDSTAARYQADKTDHRISIVTYGSSGNTRVGWTAVNASGTTTLKNNVTSLCNSSSNFSSSTTNIGAGLRQAQTLLNNLNYSGSNSDRRKVVILFTDGYPAASGDNYTQSYAEDAIAVAKQLKDANAMVFTIGIFDGADPEVTHGSLEQLGELGLDTTNIGVLGGDRNCEIYQYSDGSTDSKWLVDDDDIISDSYPIIANRFMNFMSSNFPAANKLGLSEVNRYQHTWTYTAYRYEWSWDTWSFEQVPYQATQNKTYYGYNVTDSFERASDRYYLSALDAAQLTSAFASVSYLIETGGTTIRLSERAYIKDIISDYFRLPDESTVDDIHTYTAKCTGKDPSGKFLFGDREATGEGTSFPNVQVVIEDFYKEDDRRNVSVTGFPFTDNYVAVSEAGVARGSKLIIEFVIKPIDGFSGGNNVPTNNPESGVYPSKDSPPLKPYPEPEVNYPIKPMEFHSDFEDFVIYRGNGVCIDPIFSARDMDDLLDRYVERSIYYFGRSLTAADLVDGHPKDGILAGNELAGGVVSPTATYTYPANSIWLKLGPTEDKNMVSTGDEATPVWTTNSEPFTVYVLQPTITVNANDVVQYYGAEYTLGDGMTSSSPVTVTWAEPNKLVPTAEQIEAGKTLADVISPGMLKPFDAADFTVAFDNETYTGKVSKKEVVADIQLLTDKVIDDPSIIKYNITCDQSETYGCTSPRTLPYSLVHAETCSLTVENDGGNPSETFFYTVLKDGEEYTHISVKGGETVTVSELPIGEYTIVPNNDWSWQYEITPDGDDTVTLSKDNPTGTVSFTYEVDSAPWYSIISEAIRNVFGVAKGGD